MRAKSFLQVSLGILALALAYHFGATTATAQTPGNPVVAVEGGGTVYTANGDVYQRVNSNPYTYAYYANVFSGPATTAQRTSFGELKARYRGEREPVTPSPATDR